jgi:hypothetical protein
VTNPADRQNSETIRNDVLYALQRRKDATAKEIDSMLKAKEYSKLDQTLRAALVSDSNDLEYLYYGGITAAVLRNSDTAKDYLKKYLDKSDSLAGDRAFRDRAGRVFNSLNTPKPATSNDGTPNWMSGRRLPDGVFYCPETLASQIQIESVMGNKIKWTFDWEKGRLLSIQTTFEDKDANAIKLFRQMAGLGAIDPTAPGASDEPGNFFFRYLEGGQLLGVRTRASRPLGPALAALAAPAVPAAPLAPAKPGQFRVVVASRGPKGPQFLADDENQPEIVFPSHPQVDLGVLNILEGPLGTTVAGNSFFNPFLWDGVHYFSVQYDALGRAETALEWNADNRVTFSWEGLRLKEIRAFRQNAATPYYRRTITYKGSLIDSEEVTMNSRPAGSIKYIYPATGKGLPQIRVESDGKDWVVKPRV